MHFAFTPLLAFLRRRRGDLLLPNKPVIIFLTILSLLIATAVGAQVSVSATAGTTGPTSYPTLKDAFDALNSGTHQGVITIELSASTTETAPAVLNSSGAGSANYTSVLVRPVNDAIVISAAPGSGRGIIELNGADNVVIDGDNPNTPGINRNLTVQSTNPNTATFTSCVRIATAAAVTTASDNTIKNLKLVGSNTGKNDPAATSEVVSWGIIASGNAGAAGPTALTSNSMTIGSGQSVANLVIENNEINNVSRGIAVNGTANVAAGLTISNNVIGNPVAGDPNQVTSVGITAQGSNDGVIQGNVIRVEGYVNASSSTMGSRGIDAGGVSSNGTLQIMNNKIERAINNNPAGWGAYGINVAGGTGHTIVNNFISGVYNSQVAGTGSFSNIFGAFGIRLGGGANHKVYHNTVHLSGVAPGDVGANLIACLGITTTSITGCDVRNNIFSNQLVGGNLVSTNTRLTCLALPGGTTSFNLTLNNNAYYQGGTAISTIAQNGFTHGSSTAFKAEDFVSYSTSPSTNLRSYTSGLNLSGLNDELSYAVVGAPPVVSANDLHLSTTGVTILESTGAIVGIGTDIDGQVRPGPTGSVNGGAVNPDIGADEFDGVPQVLNDLAAWELVSPANGALLPVGASGAPEASFRNMGLANQTNITVRYRILDASNNVLYNQTAVIPSLNSGALGTASFPSGVLGLAGTFTIQAIVELAGDVDASNDTLSGTITVGNPLCGTIHVGAAQPPPYNTLTNAIVALNNFGVSCPVTLLLDDQLYSSSEVFPIEISNSIPGISATDSVLIKPNAGVTATISGELPSAVLIRILSSYVTIDGSNTVGGTSRDLTIVNSGATSPQVLLVGSVNPTPITDVNIRNVVLENGANTTSTIVVGGSTGSTSSASAGYSNNIVIQNIKSINSNYGVYVTHTASAGNGTGLMIIDNDFTGSGAAGIRTNGVGVNGVDGAIIANNTIDFTDGTATGIHAGINIGSGTVNTTITGNSIKVAYNGTSTGSAIGIYITSGQAASNLIITNNQINDIISSGTTTTVANLTTGIRVTGATGNVTIAGNRINNVSNINSNGYAASGIHMNSSSATSNIQIYNNFISDINSAGNSTITRNANGIYLNTGGGYSIWNNSIHLFNDQTTGISAAINIASGVSSSGAMDIRNNIFSNFQTTATSYALYSAVTSANSAGAFGQLDYNNYWSNGTNLAYFAGSDQINLAAFTGAFQNANSEAIQPVFVSSSDLHLQNVTGNQLLDNQGIFIASVTTDIDGATRDLTTPDMGADEFSITNCVGSVGGTTTALQTAFCVTGSTIISATGYSDGAGTTYQWEYSTDNFVSDINDLVGQTTPAQAQSGVLSDTTWFRLRVTCSQSTSTDWSTPVVVYIHALPNVSIAPPAPAAICAPNTEQLSVITNAANPGYEWYFDGSPIGATTSGYAAGSTGDYTVLVTDGNTGCSATSAPVTLQVHPQSGIFAVTPSASAYCSPGSPVELVADPSLMEVTILSEDFNGATNNWVAINNTTGADPLIAATTEWTLRPDGYVYNASYPTAYHSNDNSQFYHSNSDGTSSTYTTMTHLVSPSFSTVGLTTCTLNFYQFYKDYNAGDSASVDISTDGAAWTTVWSVKSSGDYGFYDAFQQVSVDLSAYTGQPVMYVRFRYDAVWGYWWALDNVSVTGSQSAPITWTPTTDLYTDALGTVPYTGGAAQSVFAHPGATTTYTATATTPLGCVRQETATVQVNPLPVGIVTVSEPVVCLGSSTTLTAGVCGAASGFAGTFAPANWIFSQSNSDGVVATTNAPASISISSGNNGTSNSGTTNYAIDMNCDGVVSFDWVYTTIDGAAYDYPRYTINGGTPVIFPGYSTSGSTTQNGTANISVSAGDVLTLQMYTDDNSWGAANVTISNFSGPALDTVGYDIQWYDAPVGGNLLATGSTYQVTPASAGTFTYYVDVANTSTSCVNATRSSGNVQVNPPISNNTIGAPQTACIGSVPAQLTGAVPTGGDGNYTYIWESSTAGSTAGFAAASGTNNTADYMPGALTQTTWYRRVVVSGGCSDTSAAVEISVAIIASNTISGNQSVCSGDAPQVLTGSTPTGGMGGFTYIWERSTSGSSGTYSAAPGTNNAVDYTPGVLTQTSWYRRIVNSGTCSDTSASVEVKFIELPSGVIAGATDPLICAGTSIDLMGFADPVNVILLTEGFNNPTNNWVTINNSTGGTVSASNWTLRGNGYAPGGSFIGSFNSNDNSQFYFSNGDAQGNGGLQNTILQAPVMNTSGLSTLQLQFYHHFRIYNSPPDSAKIEVSTDGTNWTLVQSYIATQGSQTNFSLATVNLDSYVGHPTFYVRFRYVADWGYGWAIDNVTLSGDATQTFAWTSTPAGFTSNVQNPTAVTPTATTTYTLTVTGFGGCSASDDTVITVNPILANNTVSSAQVICSGATPAMLTGSTPTGGSGTYSYSWESSTTSSTGGFTAASGINSNSDYTPGALTQTAWYRRVVSSGSCSDTSAVIAITVEQAIVNNSISSGQTICSGATPAMLSGSTPTGGSGTYNYSWESSTTDANTGFAAASGANTNADYTPGALTQTTWFRRVVTGGACAASTSNAVEITVNPGVSITGQPAASTDICSGNTVVLEVTATNGLSYSWWKNGALVTDGGNVSGATTSSLMITNSTSSDAGTYEVVIAGNAGCDNDTSNSSVVVVNTMGTSLASNGASGSTTHYDGTVHTYTDASCQPIVTISDGNGGNTLGAVTATVTVAPTVPTAPATNQPYVQRYWVITPTNNGPATLTLYATQAEFDAYNLVAGGYPVLPTGGVDNGNVKVTKFAGNTLGSGQMTLITPVVSWDATNSWWVITFPVTDFSSFFIHTGQWALEVNLTSITAANVGDRNRVDWVTASEKNADRFELERSADGRVFGYLGTVEAKGTGSTYAYWDETPLNGVNYYRLKMLDRSGEYEYSDVVTAVVKGSFSLEVYPNPVGDQEVNVRISGTIAANAQLQLTDMTGKVIRTVKVTDQHTKLEMSNLAQGVYFIRYSDDQRTESVKLNKH